MSRTRQDLHRTRGRHTHFDCTARMQNSQFLEGEAHGSEHDRTRRLLAALTAFNLLNIRGNFVGSLPELKELVQLAQDVDLPRPPIVEVPLSAEQVNASLEGLRNRTVNGRAVLVAD